MTELPQEAQGRSTVLVVDDTPDNLELMQALLRDTYKVKGANNGQRGLQIAASDTPPDLILLDIMMPGMDGYEVCERLKSDPKTRDIPVVFLTARADLADEQRGFALGAVDYITKPISPPIVLARVKAQLALKANADLLKDKASFLESEVSRRTREISSIQDVTVMAMAALAETRGADTTSHLRRVQHYVRALAWKLSAHPRYRGFLTVAHIAMLFKAVPMHDIGKVGIPDSMLLKPGRLTPKEFEVMKTHTTLGRDAIAMAEQALGSQSPFFSMVKDTAYCHHEKWDGTGYPQGLAGDQIPIPARLMAIADMYDALITQRVYREPVSHDEAVRIVVSCRGNHFDPDVVDAFLEVKEQFQAIAMTYADTAADTRRRAELVNRSGLNPG